MRSDRIKFPALLEKTGAYTIIILAAAFMLFLTLSAFAQTSELNTNNISGENIDYLTDNVLLNLAVLAMELCALYIFFRYANAKTKRMEFVLLGFVFIFGTVFILSSKISPPVYSDSFLVTNAAMQAAKGDFSALDVYFSRFPFQLGYVLYSELLFRLMMFVLRGLPEGYYFLMLQEINLLWLCLAYYSLFRISENIFASGKVQSIFILLLFFCFQPILSTTFLYGNLPAFGCGAAGVRMFTEYQKNGEIKDAAFCAAFLALAVSLKLNLLIFCAAAGIVWLFDLLKKPGLRSALCLLAAAAVILGFRALPQKIYEERAEKSFGDGIPMLAWMAMGLSDGYAAPGWYNPDNTVAVFTRTGGDSVKTAENARAVISDRVSFFLSEPEQRRSFFSEKLRSMWNEPSFESLWINQVFSSFSEKGAAYELICVRGEKLTLIIMEQLQQLVFFGMLISFIPLWKRGELRAEILPLIILGGLLYHLLFEAKSQYALPYFILMIPLAACGLGYLFEKVGTR